MMRKIITLFIFTILLSNAFAQQKVSLGLTFSPAIAWLKGQASEVESGKIRAAFEYGILMDINLSENYALHTGILGVNNGGNLTFTDSILKLHQYDIDTDMKFKFQYLNVPLALKFKTNEIGYFTFYGLFGVMGSFRLGARVDAEQNGNTLYENESLLGDDVPGLSSNLFNLGIHVGGGFHYSLNGNTSLLVGIYFNNGFLNVLNDADDDKIALNNVGLRTGIIF